MDKIEEGIEARISAELFRGEHVMFWGPGSVSAEVPNNISNKNMILLRFLLLLNLSAFVALLGLLVNRQEPDMETLWVSLICIVFLASLLLVGKIRTELKAISDVAREYFVLTNDRLLRVRKDGIQTFAYKGDILRFSKKENNVVISLAGMDVEIVVNDDSICSQ